MMPKPPRIGARTRNEPRAQRWPWPNPSCRQSSRIEDCYQLDSAAVNPRGTPEAAEKLVKMHDRSSTRELNISKSAPQCNVGDGIGTAFGEF